MKSKLFLLIGLLIVATMVLSACQPAAPVEEPAAEEAVAEEVVEEVAEEAPLKVLSIINGTLGDKSFFDSSDRGLQRAVEEFGIELKTIETGVDPAKWQPALEDAAANEDYDILIVGTWQMVEFLGELAPNYPDKKFWIYDTGVDYSTGNYPHVYSVQYKQNEGSYLAGVYAGLMSESGILGTVGGQDIPVINDFIVGYEQGAKDVGVESVLVQYAGSWDDPAKGKELALAMYQQGADIVFQVAGGSGVGVFQAAEEMGQYALGVDSDQATIIMETDPDQAKVILTSMMKNVDNSLYRAMKMHIDGTLPYGSLETLGISEGGVGLAYNEIFDAATPDDVKATLKEYEQKVIDGEITVETVF
jgi:basic membrane protein A and related proteins